MDYERIIKEVPVNPELQAAVEALAKEGWVVDPEHPPKVVYHLMRAINPAQSEGGEMQLKLQIDETKIGILRDGKIVE